MAIKVERRNREIRDSGRVTKVFTGSDVGSSIDFMGIPEGYRITSVNVTIDEAFANADNKVSVGIEGDYVRFMPQTTINAVKGIDWNHRQMTAAADMAVIVDIVGTASAAGSGTVTVEYAKLPSHRQDY